MTRLVRLLLVLAACGSSPPTLRNTKPPQPIVHRAGPAPSLAEAMADHGLTPIHLAAVRRDMELGPSGAAVTARGGTVIVHETRGWRGSTTTFARRASDNAIVIVGANVTFVERKVPAGCMTFAGGRGWFETVEYQLPPNDRYGGVVEVAYVEHVDVPVYSDRQPDGSPCPPPAVD